MTSKEKDLQQLVRQIISETDKRNLLSNLKLLKQGIADAPINSTQIKGIFDRIAQFDKVLQERDTQIKESIVSIIALIGVNLQTETRRFIIWISQILSTNQSDKNTFLNILLEFINIGNISVIGAHITLILDNLKTFLEKGVKFENLSLTIDILLFISKKYPSQFNLYFKDLVDVLIGWRLHSSLPEQIGNDILNGMKEMRSCWLQNIQLVNSLLNSFLVDMQHQSKLNKQQLPPIQSDRNPNLQRSISFISCFVCIIESCGKALIQKDGSIIYLVDRLFQFFKSLHTYYCLDDPALILFLNESIKTIYESLQEYTSACFTSTIEFLLMQLNECISWKSSKVLFELMIKLIEMQGNKLELASCKKLIETYSVISLSRLHGDNRITSVVHSIYQLLLKSSSPSISKFLISHFFDELHHFHELLEESFASHQLPNPISSSTASLPSFQHPSNTLQDDPPSPSIAPAAASPVSTSGKVIASDLQPLEGYNKQIGGKGIIVAIPRSNSNPLAGSTTSVSSINTSNRVKLTMKELELLFSFNILFLSSSKLESYHSFEKIITKYNPVENDTIAKLPIAKRSVITAIQSFYKVNKQIIHNNHSLLSSLKQLIFLLLSHPIHSSSRKTLKLTLHWISSMIELDSIHILDSSSSPSIPSSSCIRWNNEQYSYQLPFNINEMIDHLYIQSRNADAGCRLSIALLSKQLLEKYWKFISVGQFEKLFYYSYLSLSDRILAVRNIYVKLISFSSVVIHSHSKYFHFIVDNYLLQIHKKYKQIYSCPPLKSFHFVKIVHYLNNNNPFHLSSSSNPASSASSVSSSSPSASSSTLHSEFNAFIHQTFSNSQILFHLQKLCEQSKNTDEFARKNVLEIMNCTDVFKYYWLIWEAAKFCVSSRLKTPFGDPRDTFKMIEQFLYQGTAADDFYSLRLLSPPPPSSSSSSSSSSTQSVVTRSSSQPQSQSQSQSQSSPSRQPSPLLSSQGGVVSKSAAVIASNTNKAPQQQVATASSTLQGVGRPSQQAQTQAQPLPSQAQQKQIQVASYLLIKDKLQFYDDLQKQMYNAYNGSICIQSKGIDQFFRMNKKTCVDLFSKMRTAATGCSIVSGNDNDIVYYSSQKLVDIHADLLKLIQQHQSLAQKISMKYQSEVEYCLSHLLKSLCNLHEYDSLCGYILFFKSLFSPFSYSFPWLKPIQLQTLMHYEDAYYEYKSILLSNFNPPTSTTSPPPSPLSAYIIKFIIDQIHECLFRLSDWELLHEWESMVMSHEKLKSIAGLVSTTPAGSTTPAAAQDAFHTQSIEFNYLKALAEYDSANYSAAGGLLNEVAKKSSSTVLAGNSIPGTNLHSSNVNNNISCGIPNPLHQPIQISYKQYKQNLSIKLLDLLLEIRRKYAHSPHSTSAPSENYKDIKKSMDNIVEMLSNECLHSYSLQQTCIESKLELEYLIYSVYSLQLQLESQISNKKNDNQNQHQQQNNHFNYFNQFDISNVLFHFNHQLNASIHNPSTWMHLLRIYDVHKFIFSSFSSPGTAACEVEGEGGRGYYANQLILPIIKLSRKQNNQRMAKRLLVKTDKGLESMVEECLLPLNKHQHHLPSGKQPVSPSSYFECLYNLQEIIKTQDLFDKNSTVISKMWRSIASLLHKHKYKIEEREYYLFSVGSSHPQKQSPFILRDYQDKLSNHLQNSSTPSLVEYFHATLPTMSDLAQQFPFSSLLDQQSITLHNPISSSSSTERISVMNVSSGGNANSKLIDIITMLEGECIKKSMMSDSDSIQSYQLYANWCYHQGKRVIDRISQEQLSYYDDEINKITDIIMEEKAKDLPVPAEDEDRPPGIAMKQPDTVGPLEKNKIHSIAQLLHTYIRNQNSESSQAVVDTQESISFQLNELLGGEYDTNKSIIDKLMKYTSEIQLNLIQYYQLAVTVYFKYLHKGWLPSGSPHESSGHIRAENGSSGAGGRVGDDNIIATLRILRILVKYGEYLKEEFIKELNNTPTNAWIGIIPQLFSRLSHPNKFIQSIVKDLLVKIGFDYPNEIIFQVIVGELEEESELQSNIISLTNYNLISTNSNLTTLSSSTNTQQQQERPFKQISKLLNEKYPKLIGEVRTLLNEFTRITLLWHESGIFLLNRINHEIKQRINTMKEEYKRISDNEEMNGSEKMKVIYEKYRTLMKIFEIQINNYIELISKSPETNFEKWFQKTYLERFKVALENFKNPPDLSDPIVVWRPFEKILEELNRLMKNTQQLKDISPKLSSFKTSSISMPGLTSNIQNNSIHTTAYNRISSIVHGTPGTHPSLSPSQPGDPAWNECITTTIHSFLPNVSILPTKTKPKKLILLGSDGNQYAYLLKGKEDLHLDERIMQFLTIINQIFNRVKETRIRNLSARKYAVIPIGRRSGLIQWVDDATAIYQVYKQWHKRLFNNPSNPPPSQPPPSAGQPLPLPLPLPQLGAQANIPLHQQEQGQGQGAVQQQPMNVPTVINTATDHYFSKLIPALQSVGINDLNNRKIWPKELMKQVFLELQSEIAQDILEKELWLSSISTSNYFNKSLTFTRSVAVMSIIGYIIGLGDRHLENLLIDFNTGEIIHIDYNICFESGLKLRIPETIPFRLTKIMEKAFGVTGVEGAFRITCYHVLRTLRKNKETLLTLLEAFVYDPLIDWTLDKEDSLQRTQIELNINLSLFSSRVNENKQKLVELSKRFQSNLLKYYECLTSKWDLLNLQNEKISSLVKFKKCKSKISHLNNQMERLLRKENEYEEEKARITNNQSIFFKKWTMQKSKLQIVSNKLTNKLDMLLKYSKQIHAPHSQFHREVESKINLSTNQYINKHASTPLPDASAERLTDWERLLNDALLSNLPNKYNDILSSFHLSFNEMKQLYSTRDSLIASLFTCLHQYRSFIFNSASLTGDASIPDVNSLEGSAGACNPLSIKAITDYIHHSMSIYQWKCIYSRLYNYLSSYLTMHDNDEDPGSNGEALRLKMKEIQEKTEEIMSNQEKINEIEWMMNALKLKKMAISKEISEIYLKSTKCKHTSKITLASSGDKWPSERIVIDDDLLTLYDDSINSWNIFLFLFYLLSFSSPFHIHSYTNQLHFKLEHASHSQEDDEQARSLPSDAPGTLCRTPEEQSELEKEEYEKYCEYLNKMNKLRIILETERNGEKEKEEQERYFREWYQWISDNMQLEEKMRKMKGKMMKYGRGELRKDINLMNIEDYDNKIHCIRKTQSKMNKIFSKINSIKEKIKKSKEKEKLSRQNIEQCNIELENYEKTVETHTWEDKAEIEDIQRKISEYNDNLTSLPSHIAHLLKILDTLNSKINKTEKYLADILHSPPSDAADASCGSATVLFANYFHFFEELRVCYALLYKKDAAMEEEEEKEVFGNEKMNVLIKIIEIIERENQKMGKKEEEAEGERSREDKLADIMQIDEFLQEINKQSEQWVHKFYNKLIKAKFKKETNARIEQILERVPSSLLAKLNDAEDAEETTEESIIIKRSKKEGGRGKEYVRMKKEDMKNLLEAEIDSGKEAREAHATYRENYFNLLVERMENQIKREQEERKNNEKRKELKRKKEEIEKKEKELEIMYEHIINLSHSKSLKEQHAGDPEGKREERPDEEKPLEGTEDAGTDSKEEIQAIEREKEGSRRERKEESEKIVSKMQGIMNRMKMNEKQLEEMNEKYKTHENKVNEIISWEKRDENNFHIVFNEKTKERRKIMEKRREEVKEFMEIVENFINIQHFRNPQSEFNKNFNEKQKAYLDSQIQATYAKYMENQTKLLEIENNKEQNEGEMREIHEKIGEMERKLPGIRSEFEEKQKKYCEIIKNLQKDSNELEDIYRNYSSICKGLNQLLKLILKQTEQLSEESVHLLANHLLKDYQQFLYLSEALLKPLILLIKDDYLPPIAPSSSSSAGKAQHDPATTTSTTPSAIYEFNQFMERYSLDADCFRKLLHSTKDMDQLARLPCILLDQFIQLSDASSIVNQSSTPPSTLPAASASTLLENNDDTVNRDNNHAMGTTHTTVVGGGSGNSSFVGARLTQERNIYALHTLKRIKAKLQGLDGVPEKLSVAEQVDLVIQNATSVDNLSVLYEGWTAWI